MTQKQMGPLLASAAVEELQRGNRLFNLFCASSLMRYFNNDWGEISQEDREMNDKVLQNGGERIMASYNFPDGTHWGGEDCLWIVTEADGSSTTLLFPGEY